MATPVLAPLEIQATVGVGVAPGAGATPALLKLQNAVNASLVAGNSDGFNAVVQLTSYGSARNAVLHGRAARGTLAAPTKVLSGDLLLRIRADGAYDSGGGAGAFASARQADITFHATEDYVDGAHLGSRIAFGVTPTASASVVETLSLTSTALTLTDAVNVAVGTATGTRIGTATTQKLGFFNATPVVQPANTTDLRAALIALGLLASGGATPLDLNGGALTAADVSVVASAAASLTVDNASSKVDQSAWDVSMVQVGRNLNSSGNEFGVSIQTRTTVDTSAGASYEKAALLVMARTNDPSGATLRDMVGIDTRGLISPTISTGRAWGLYSRAEILSGGDGYLVAGEFDTINEGADQGSVGTTTSKYGVHLVASGSVNSTAGVYVNRAGSVGWHYGVFVGQNAVASGGYAYYYAEGSTILFGVDYLGNVIANSYRGTNNRVWWIQQDPGIPTAAHTPATTDFVKVGITTTALAVNGATTTGASTLDAADGQYVLFSSATTSGTSKAGIEFPSSAPATPIMQFQRNSITTFVIRTDSTITNLRLFVGWFSADPTGADSTNSIHAMGFRFSTGASDTKFQLITGNGTTMTVTAPAAAAPTVAASTRYVLRVDASSGTDVKFWVNNVLVGTVSATLPGATQSLMAVCELRTLTNAARKVAFGMMRVEVE